ncbi:MAG: SpoIID/LytB domain-containing protein [Acidobacteria bacterium]|nr:SpoIID/LytB domain-containing protein [Acidobacteriota bacterium]
MKPIERQPIVSVGLMASVETVRFELKGEFVDSTGVRFRADGYQSVAACDRVEIIDADGRRFSAGEELRLKPISDDSLFVIRDVVIGIDFHWEQTHDQQFQGALRLKLGADKRLAVINEIPVEAYLTSVISSEMSATADAELLKAHAVISRSWLLAQMKQWKRPRIKCEPKIETVNGERQLIRWYDQETHTDFDVCADDHCQRYQGITKASSLKVFDAIQATFGRVLEFEGELCDARFSKSCGGMTESFDAAWADECYAYLAVSYDGETFPAEFTLPLSVEANAEAWIRSSPPAFCNTIDSKVLGKILPDFDQATRDFYRWRTTIAQAELQELLQRKLGIDFGAVLRLEPVERAESGRLRKLRIVGERETLVIGKELEIRRALSPSHLYSSAFVIETSETGSNAPDGFTLIGAGWGHGVGLCQIGAALMAERAYGFEQILGHYYHGAQLQALYSN